MSVFRKKCLWICGVSVTGFAAFVAAYTFLYSRFPAFFECFARNIARIYCPACGCSRAVTAILSFDLPGFLFYSPALAVLCGILIWFGITVIIAFVKDSAEPLRKFPYKIFWLVFAVAILTCIVRNVALEFGVDLLGDILVS